MLEILIQLALTFVMIVLYAVVFCLVYARVMGGMFNRAKFDPSRETNNDVRFKDVLGIDEAKREAQEVVDFLKNAQTFERIGAKIPKGILLVGPPGTGKTLLAKAIANEAGVPFYSLSGADFVEVFVGVGASRIRSLYKKARKHPAAIVFIDEIDALGRSRSSNQFGGQEGNNTLNQFLVELDGFGRDSNVITIGATNYEESLDTALLRPGRFDRKIHVGLPDLKGREALLAHYSRKVQLDRSVDLRALARAATNMSGADLASVVNEASILAVRERRSQVRHEDFSKAMERLGIGLENASHPLNPHERRVVAYHEAGHAVVSLRTQPHKRLHKASIIPTGRHALGYTWSVEREDRHLITREEYCSELAVLMGGRVAEEMVFGEVTSGAHSDLKRATKIAELLVWELGMLGGSPINYKELTCSEATRERLDLAVEQVLREAYEQAREVLIERREDLERLAQGLLDHEVLYEPDIHAVLRGTKPKRNASDGDRNEWVA
ncbi:AAA family ATPase [bacterium]|nr:AAA family ATPase [bacterium]